MSVSREFKLFFMDKIDFASFVDPGILAAVEILNAHGFETVESCQGGEGHCYDLPTVRFKGNEFDVIRAYELCLAHRLCVLEGKRVYRKCTDIIKDNNWANPLGQTYEPVLNELVFMIHLKTGTIFLPD